MQSLPSRSLQHTADRLPSTSLQGKVVATKRQATKATQPRRKILYNDFQRYSSRHPGQVRCLFAQQCRVQQQKHPPK